MVFAFTELRLSAEVARTQDIFRTDIAHISAQTCSEAPGCAKVMKATTVTYGPGEVARVESFVLNDESDDEAESDIDGVLDDHTEEVNVCTCVLAWLFGYKGGWLGVRMMGQMMKFRVIDCAFDEETGEVRACLRACMCLDAWVGEKVTGCVNDESHFDIDRKIGGTFDELPRRCVFLRVGKRVCK